MRFYLFALAVTAAGVAATTALAQGPAPLKNDPLHPAAAVAAAPLVAQARFAAGGKA